MGACGSKAETARGIESGDGRGKVGIPAGAFPVHLTTFEAPVLSVTGAQGSGNARRSDPPDPPRG